MTTVTRRNNRFIWNAHTAIHQKTIKPGTLEDKRFLALALAGEAGELANLVKKGVARRPDTEPARPDSG